MHTYWTCPCNLQITDPAVTKTQHLVEEAITGSQEFQCLWLRGILPKKLLEIPEEYTPAEKHIIAVKVNEGEQLPTAGQWPEGDYFGDGSGGSSSSFIEGRRCGAGVAYYDKEKKLGFLASQALEGVVQTVPRAELQALIMVAENLREGAAITYYIDNKPSTTPSGKGMKEP